MLKYLPGDILPLLSSKDGALVVTSGHHVDIQLGSIIIYYHTLVVSYRAIITPALNFGLKPAARAVAPARPAYKSGNKVGNTLSGYVF